MKHFITRLTIASLLVMAFGLLATDSKAALNAYLMLKGRNTGKTYRTTIDASGKFSFASVEPDVYELSITCDGKGDCPSSIEISSFSWGVSNAASSATGNSMSSGRSTQVTRSNISNNRTAAAPVTTSSGVRVATGDLDGDGVMDIITSPVSVTLGGNKPGTSTNPYQIVLREVMVSSVCSPKGDIKASYDLKMNTK